MTNSIVISILNILWFGVWLYIIFWLHHSGWWILVPLMFHWTISDPSEEK